LKLLIMAKETKLNFGKHKGRKLKDVFKEDRAYVQWMYDTFEKGSFLQNAAAWLIEGTGEKKRAEFLRAKVSMDKQFEKALDNND